MKEFCVPYLQLPVLGCVKVVSSDLIVCMNTSVSKGGETKWRGVGDVMMEG